MIVYMITNRINGKRYVGQTVQTLKRRFQQHCRRSKGKRDFSVLKSAIQKYGKENFEIKILSRCDSIEEMNHRESYYIILLKTACPSGYNMDSGGLNKIPSLESREKMSKAGKGRVLTEEHKTKISESQKGVPRKKWTSEQKRKASEARKLKPHNSGPKTEETKKLMSRLAQIRESDPLYKEKRIEWSKKRRVRVICNETGIIYESVKAASIAMKCFKSQMTSVINGRAKTVKGFTFSKLV